MVISPPLGDGWSFRHDQNDLRQRPCKVRVCSPELAGTEAMTAFQAPTEASGV